MATILSIGGVVLTFSTITYLRIGYFEKAIVHGLLAAFVASIAYLVWKEMLREREEWRFFSRKPLRVKLKKTKGLPVSTAQRGEPSDSSASDTPSSLGPRG
jgi:hypothetical protein